MRRLWLTEDIKLKTKGDHMKKILILLFLTGCFNKGNNINETIFINVNRDCPKICSNWTGFLKAQIDVLKCVCDDSKE